MILQNASREPNLADYFAVIRRYVWLIVATTIIVPVVAYVASAQQPKVFRATSEVLLTRQDLGSVITGIPTSNTVVEPDRDARTQAALARVPAVAQSAVRRADVPGLKPWELLASSTVTARENTDLLTFAASNSDPEIAARLSSAYAKAFTSYKLAMDTTSLSRARRDLQLRLDELRRAGGAGGAAYRQLLQKSQDLRTLELLQVPASVVRAATSATQVAPTPRRNAVLGMLLGLVLGVGGAFVLNAFDRRIRHAEELERELQIPLLARLPAPRERGDRLTILDRPADEVTEAVSRLRANFDFANSELQAKLVMFTSVGAREGKSTTISNLAIALSRTGRHVVLVDLDLHRPALARMFHLPDKIGLTDVATRGLGIEDALNPIIHTPRRSWPAIVRDNNATAGALEVVTAGRTHVEPSDFIETRGLADILNQLRSRADIVLIDASPILAAGDAMALTAKVDAILLINRLGTLRRPAIRDLARALDRSPAPTLGLVATGAAVDESYAVYRAEDKSYPELAGRSRQVPEHQQLTDAPSVREAGAGTGRWGRPPSSGR